MLKLITKLSGASLPAGILQRLDDVKGDDEAVKQVGIELVSEIIEKIKAANPSGPRGFHFYTLDLDKFVSFIIERTILLALILLRDESVFEEIEGPTVNGVALRRNRRTSSVTSDPHNRVIADNSSFLQSPRLANALEAGFLGPPEQAQAIKLWSCPVNKQDISDIFVLHIKGELDAIP